MKTFRGKNVDVKELYFLSGFSSSLCFNISSNAKASDRFEYSAYVFDKSAIKRFKSKIAFIKRKIVR